MHGLIIKRDKRGHIRALPGKVAAKTRGARSGRKACEGGVRWGWGGEGSLGVRVEGRTHTMGETAVKSAGPFLRLRGENARVRAECVAEGGLWLRRDVGG